MAGKDISILAISKYNATEHIAVLNADKFIFLFEQQKLA